MVWQAHREMLFDATYRLLTREVLLSDMALLCADHYGLKAQWDAAAAVLEVA